jgi:hypothetical protein
MKKTYLLICIPPTAAMLAFLVINYGFREGSPNLLPSPTQAEIEAAPWKTPPKNGGGGGNPQFDQQKFDDYIRKLNDGKNAPEEAPVSKPAVSEPKGPFREDLIKQHNEIVLKNRDIVAAHNRYNHIVKLTACFASMLVAIGGYVGVGIYLYRQYKAPQGEETLAAAVQQPAAAEGQPSAAPAAGAAPPGQQAPAAVATETTHVNKSHELLSHDPEEDQAYFIPPDETAPFFEDEAPPASEPDKEK